MELYHKKETLKNFATQLVVIDWRRGKELEYHVRVAVPRVLICINPKLYRSVYRCAEVSQKHLRFLDACRGVVYRRLCLSKEKVYLPKTNTIYLKRLCAYMDRSLWSNITFMLAHTKTD